MGINRLQGRFRHFKPLCFLRSSIICASVWHGTQRGTRCLAVQLNEPAGLSSITTAPRMLTVGWAQAVRPYILRVSRSVHTARGSGLGQSCPTCTKARVCHPHLPFWRAQQHSTLARAASSATPLMDDALTEYIRHIHDAPLQGVFHATGGGMQVNANVCFRVLCHVGETCKEQLERHKMCSAGLDVVVDGPWCVKDSD